MEEQKEILENRAKITEQQVKLQALLNILSREGIIEEEDFSEEFSSLLSSKE